MLFKRKPKGRITHPRNHDVVPRRFRAAGTMDRLPAGEHPFLVVEVGGLLWPKGEAQLMDRSWTSEIYEGGAPPDGRFTLSLYLVSDQGYAEIAAWLEHGQSTGNYPGLREIKGGAKLHSVKLP